MSNIKINEVVLSHSPAPDLRIRVQEFKPRKWSERYVSKYIAWVDGQDDYSACGEGISEAIGNLILQLIAESDYAGLSLKNGTFPGSLGEFTMDADRYERVEEEDEEDIWQL